VVPAANLPFWKAVSLVVSVDLDGVNAGGTLLAVWGGTYRP
jgi:hypothetical protein